MPSVNSRQATSRLHWPRAGVALRVPPRRLVASSPTCSLIAFAGGRAEAARPVAWDALAAGLPRGVPVVLLVAAEDVSFSEADVPALSGLRLREALPNLVEEKTVGDPGSLHVALGQAAGSGRRRTLAVVDRTWLAAMQVHVVRSGHRVAAIVPESLAVPFVDDAWSLACVEGASPGASRCWLRTAGQQALSLPDDPDSATAIASALMRQCPPDARPSQLILHAAPPVAAAGRQLAASLAASLALTTPAAPPAPTDPFAAWLAGDGPDGGYGPPLSLLAFDGGSGRDAFARWRVAAALLLAMLVVQVAGMQVEWGRMRHEADRLRQRANTMLTTTFPDTRVVVDAPLQMARGLAALRASSGHSDPADFSTMIAASARIFGALPSNALRGADYEGRALRLRFAPGAATGADERDRLVAAAQQEGYVLRFEPAANAAGESLASLKTRGGAS